MYTGMAHEHWTMGKVYIKFCHGKVATLIESFARLYGDWDKASRAKRTENFREGESETDLSDNTWLM